ncbi:UvrD-helicase domain-containing protein [uncultured Weeksella sp.]|uniref:UvrD-helicase domain-containing protein n=1 Tax=uncultured Weeksella sp. TaxID=1161389 RepID=UPI00259BE054|nr:UvrD-helicase domain-containing protein [uncultured Weeksella sp.]
MIQVGDFKLYNASAGAGKTYTLVRNLLIILLQNSRDNWFEYILAITFTNKAANEMKERILLNLKELADPTKKQNDYIQGIAKDTKLSIDEIQQKAHRILTSILHNYSKFSISTIDKFNLRLIKSFAQDLGLSMSFDVEMDVKTLIEEAVNLVYSKIGKDEELTESILDMSLSNMEEDASWNIRYSLKKLAENLASDIHLEELSKMNMLGLQDFDKFRLQLANRQKELYEDYHTIYLAFNELLKSHNLSVDDFPQKSRGIGGFFNKFNKYKDKKIVNLNSYSQKTLDGEYNEKHPLIVPVIGELNVLYQAVTQLNQKNILYNALQKNIQALSLNNEIRKALEEIKKENNLLLINEFNTLISEHIQNQPSPFIYEKIGSKFKHYFIDEFQDTSTLQWKNMYPLIENAYAQNDTIMLVGDVKQSIYRWRGGNPNLMINIKEQIPSIKIENLDTNWRSYENIILFNNSLYQSISKNLSSNSHQAIYQAGSNQLTNPKKGGYVLVEFLEETAEKKMNEVHLDRVLETVERIKKDGFLYSDIAILVRKNDKGTLVAEHLAKANIPIISNEALLLKNAAVIQFIECLLQIAHQPLNKQQIAKSFLLAYQMNLLHQVDFTELISDAIQDSPESFLIVYQRLGYDLRFLFDENLSLYDLIEQLLNIFPFESSTDAYRIAFLDEVLSFTSKNETTIANFLAHWNIKKEKLSLQTPKGVDALQIMTIHKSKGLEFPVVIYPFIEDKINYNSDIWIPLEKEEDQPFESFYVTITSDLKIIENREIKTIIEEENHLNELDNLNVLYVATTRAKEQLYLFANLPKDNGKEEKPAINSWLYKFVREQQPKNESNRFELFGEAIRVSGQEEILKEGIDIPYYQQNWTNHLAISTNSEKTKQERERTAFANAIHSILSKIFLQEDAEKAIEVEMHSTLLNKEEKTKVEKLIYQIINHPQLAEFYNNPKSVILNERDFIAEDGQIFRADRVVIHQKNLSIIDYKTGSPQLKHQSQIDHYANFFNQLGYTSIKKILVYIDSQGQTISIDEVN